MSSGGMGRCGRVFRYALPNDDGSYDLFQIMADEDEGLLLCERMGVEILSKVDIDCGKNVLKLGLLGAHAFWLSIGKGGHDPERALVAHNVTVLSRLDGA